MTEENILKIKEVIDGYDQFSPEERKTKILEVLDFDDFVETSDDELLKLKHQFKETYNAELIALYDEYGDDEDQTIEETE